MSRKTVLVTGGTRGIGRAICEDLAKDWHVLVGGRSEVAARVASSLESAEPWVVDITDEEAVREACAKIDSLDALVLSAGISTGKPIAEATREDWETILDVIKSADWVIDMGPEGGSGGGKVIATGTPEQVSEVKGSFTGQYLAKVLAK